MEIFFKDPESKWNEGVLLDEYNGEFRLISSQENEGKIYKKWCYPVGKDKKPIDKMFPIGVRMGSKTQAMATLKYFLEQLTNSAEPPDDDEAPF